MLSYRIQPLPLTMDILTVTGRSLYNSLITGKTGDESECSTKPMQFPVFNELTDQLYVNTLGRALKKKRQQWEVVILWCSLSAYELLLSLQFCYRIAFFLQVWGSQKTFNVYCYSLEANSTISVVGWRLKSIMAASKTGNSYVAFCITDTNEMGSAGFRAENEQTNYSCTICLLLKRRVSRVTIIGTVNK